MSRLLAGRYRTIRRLGAGGMATVFLAEDERLGRRVAVKRLHGEPSDDDVGLRFQREARLGASLNHPNVVAVFDIETDPEGVLIVMEHVEGHTLRDEIAAGPIPADRALPILRDVAAALDHAHDHGVVHRDVKPANVLLRARDGQAKLADLGIATAAEHSRITRSGAVLGTAAYMAPERLDGRAGDWTVDVYALAAVAFEMLSGRKAVEGATPLAVAQRVVSEPPPDLCEVVPGAPPAAAAVLRRGLDRDPTRRPASAGELVDRLGRAYAAPAPSAPPPPPSTAPTAPVETSGRFRNQEKRNTPLIAAAAIVVAAIAAVLLLSGGGGRGERSAARPAPARAHAKKAHRRSAAAPAPAAAASPAQDPAAAVNGFYQHAAAHEYASAWAMGTDRLHAQLGSYASFAASQSTLRSIAFPLLRTTSSTSTEATVELRSSAIHTDRVDHVCGTVGLVRAGAAWKLDSLHLDTCASAAAPGPAGSAQAGDRAKPGKGAGHGRGHDRHGPKSGGPGD